VKGRRPDQWLHDYLDGRLSAEEQAQAEARIREDSELGRRVAAWRKIGNALREDSAELSPGFHTRARARFEQSLKPRRGFGRRLFSWEAAGLAAAMVLAVALFLPELMQDGLPSHSPARQADAATPLAEGAPPKAEAFAPEPAGEAASDAKHRAPAPLAKPVRAADAPGSRLRASAGPVVTAVNAVPLPGGTPAPQGLHVIDDRSTWDAWLAGPAGTALSRLGGYGPGRRLVLVGRPGGIDCSTVTVSRLRNEYRVAFHDGGGAASGCAFVLSDADGIAVVLERPGAGGGR